MPNVPGTGGLSPYRLTPNGLLPHLRSWQSDQGALSSVRHAPFAGLHLPGMLGEPGAVLVLRYEVPDR